jgi:hypothetical protein
MPEPHSAPRAGGPVPIWPDELPQPDATSLSMTAGPRTEAADVAFGPTRVAVKARTAPMSWAFACGFTKAQMQTFEGFYRNCLETTDGEFYARWIGGSRVVAFSEAYNYVPLGDGWRLSGRLIRTRIDDTVCNDYIESFFGAIYRAELGAADIYQADLAAPDIYADDFDLDFIAAHEC